MKKSILLSLVVLLVACKMHAQNYVRTPRGAQYLIVSPKTGDRIKLEDVITFNAIQKTDKDSVLFSSYATGHPVQLQIKPSQNVGDLMDIFTLLTLKDSVIVKVPADSVFAGHEESRPPFLPKGSSLTFIMKIERIQSFAEAMAERNAAMAAEKAAAEKMKADEGSIASKYITDHNLTLKTTPTGLRYQINQESAKPKITKGDTVFVNYTGRSTDDKVFDSSIEAVAKQANLQQPGRNYEPIKFVVGEGMVIKGWDEGLTLLSEGSKATFVIPSALAYGDQGAGEAIAPFSTLVFDVEVVKVIKGKVPVKKPVVKKPLAKKGTAPAKKPAAAATVKKPAAPAATKN